MSYDENRISDLIDGGLIQQEAIFEKMCNDRLVINAFLDQFPENIPAQQMKIYIEPFLEQRHLDKPNPFL